MNRWNTFSAAVLLALVLQPLAAQNNAVSAEKLLARAQHKASVERDLKAAIEDYKAAVAAAGSNRALAARALIELAECYSKLGDSEAQTTYERIVREFADQADASVTARARLQLAGRDRSASGAIKRQLWAGGDVQGHAISADGRLVSYCESGDVVVREVATQRERRPATAPRPGAGDYAETCMISRQGTQVAYSWANHATLRYELRVVAAVGGAAEAPRVLVNNPDVEFITPLDWSPDGRTLAIRLTRGDRTTQLALVTMSHGAITVLRSVDWRGPSAAAFSNDGKYLAYDLIADDDTTRLDIHVMPIDARRDVRVVAHAANDALVGWSPDDRRLLFVSDRSGSPALWAQPIDAGQADGSPTLVRPDLGTVVRTIGLTRSGDLVYAQRTAAISVHTAEVDFSTGLLLKPPAPVVETYLKGQASPAWSTDGQSLAWTSPSSFGLRRMGVTVQALKTMTTTEYAPELAGGALRGWTPDGSLVYHGMDLKGRPGIFQVSVRDGGTTPIALANDGFFTLPSWSNDGRFFVYRHQTTGGGEMVLLDRTANRSRTLLANRPFGLFAVAPDGKSVAFVEPLQAPRSLNVLTIETGAIQKIFAPGGNETISGFQWLPDSRRLVAWTSSGSVASGSVVPVDGGVAVRLDPSTPPAFTIHPDGRRIAFTSGQRKIEVWMLQNFLPAVKKQSAR